MGGDTLVTKRRPDARLFVVRGADRDQLQKVVEDEPDLESLEEIGDDSEVLVVTVRSGQLESKAAWEHVQEVVGGEHFVAPVLEDEDGYRHYPTGTIQVRFTEAPTDAELQSFAVRHGLRLLGRNRYQAAQASFELTDPSGVFLPEKVDPLNDSSEVRVAWEEAEAVYKR